MLRKSSFILIFILLIGGLVEAQTLISEKDVKFDSNIESLFDSIENQEAFSLDKFNPELREIYETPKNFYDSNVKNDRIYISVTIRDYSRVVYNGTKEEKHKQWEIQNEWYKNKIDEITSILTEEEFILYRKNPVSFSGLVSEEGLEKLKNMEEIVAIELNYYGDSAISDSVPLINAPYAWSSGYTGEGIDICIIDSGLKPDWSIIFNNLEEEYCYCDHSILPGGCCPNGGVTDTSAQEDETGHGTLDASESACP